MSWLLSSRLRERLRQDTPRAYGLTLARTLKFYYTARVDLCLTVARLVSLPRVDLGLTVARMVSPVI